MSWTPFFECDECGERHWLRDILNDQRSVTVECSCGNEWYVAKCFECGSVVDSRYGERCADCNWIECECGACGCTFDGWTGTSAHYYDDDDDDEDEWDEEEEEDDEEYYYRPRAPQPTVMPVPRPVEPDPSPPRDWFGELDDYLNAWRERVKKRGRREE
ncbi:MAG: hypothetical protein KatS3mg015_0303 [Fimbriimonadales bacterium]|nr:MAG: hypothetical protein KatS3mg015_0303 [Fimbriimonadales bacterium]